MKVNESGNKEDLVDEIIEDTVDEYDDYQYEYSSEIAYKFIDEEIIPFLEEFDYDNPEEDYVPGMATFSLYTKLIELLILDGYSVEHLKEVIDGFSVEYISDTVH